MSDNHRRMMFHLPEIIVTRQTPASEPDTEIGAGRQFLCTAPLTLSISNADGLIRTLRDNQEFRTAARRELLTEEFLRVLGQLVETQKKPKRILNEQKELRAKSDALQDAQNALLDTVPALLRESGETRTDIRGLHGHVPA